MTVENSFELATARRGVEPIRISILPQVVVTVGDDEPMPMII
jgi:hypothetical protein